MGFLGLLASPSATFTAGSPGTAGPRWSPRLWVAGLPWSPRRSFQGPKPGSQPNRQTSGSGWDRTSGCYECSRESTKQNRESNRVSVMQEGGTVSCSNASPGPQVPSPLGPGLMQESVLLSGLFSDGKLKILATSSSLLIAKRKVHTDNQFLSERNHAQVCPH